MKNKRLSRVLSLVLALALLLTGCTTSGGSSGTTTSTTTATVATTTAVTTAVPEEKASLSVYIYTGGMTKQTCYIEEVEDFADDYQDMVDMTITEFTDTAEMESRLKLELAAGQGPDIIMADVDFGLDMMVLAKNGAFYDMTDVIAADASFNDEEYFLSVMKAGQLDDRQYVIPLSFTLPAFVSTAEAMDEMGINLETDTTIDVFEKMLAYLKSTDEPQVSSHSGYVDTILALMLSCGKTTAFDQSRDADLGGEEERILMELGAELVRDRNAWYNASRDITDTGAAIAKTALTYVNLYVSPYALQNYYSMRVTADENADVVFYFASDAEGNHHALVQEFAAVSANAKNPALAWQFLKAIMDHREIGNSYAAVSLNRDVTLRGISSATNTTLGRGLEKLPQELGDQMLAACETITDASVYQNSPLTIIFREGVRDYRDGVVIFDRMVEDIQNKVKLYINE